ncbi:helix-turn-helix domain-containing protein [Dyadobacter flavalbus]|uniref:Helix-turn-helix domain-containing protein n=1 Tax=Dyadobacter flavalbus TaxID=2579942 RepID=A0A5M8R307_9BACT|nr:helix-turn-helix domain-containing protein [Dyadobacter flavalbus]
MSSSIETVRICQECNKRFTARTTQTRFCCLKCNRRNYKKRVRQGKVEQSEKETVERRQVSKNKTSAGDTSAKNYLSVQDTCSLLTISRTTLWRLISDRKIKSVKLGRRIVISRSSIDKLFI